MYKYKKGDLIKHGPTGEIGIYITIRGSGEMEVRKLSLENFEKGPILYWKKHQCTPCIKIANIQLYQAAKEFSEYIKRCDSDMGDASFLHLCLEDALKTIKESGLNDNPIESGWITDRGPTEEDADDRGLIYVYTINYHTNIPGSWTSSVENYHHHHMKNDNFIPWQPVPMCLQTPPPDEKTCNQCAHYRTSENTTEYCRKVDLFVFKQGMPGCQFTPKKN